MKVRSVLPVPRLATWRRTAHEASSAPTNQVPECELPVPRAVAQRILLSLLFPAMLMPLASSMANVALPTIRDQFAIRADMTAWVATAFTLPFMVFMPVYGRLSDGVGKRRLILGGLALFTFGTAITLVATDLVWLMVGRAIQGFGTAGMVPLGLAFLSSVFHPAERGEALGKWSSMGPMMGFLSPVVAGFLVDHWGWRTAFAPPLLLGIFTIVIVARLVPAGLSTIVPHFWRRFDWVGVGLLSSAICAVLFFMSSRPITGVAPLQDWRLASFAAILFVFFLLWERRRSNPFVLLKLFRHRSFTLASLVASLRMVIMAGSSFLLPLYLADVRGLGPTATGFLLMIIPGSMFFVVRLGGRLADNLGARTPVFIGGIVQIIIMAAYALLPQTAPLWVLCVMLSVQGLGVGLMLASLHSAAMIGVAEEEMGAAAGQYSMVRFAGSTFGTALIGVLLQFNLDRGLSTLNAYQNVYLCLAGVAVLGLLCATGLKGRSTA
ncbi:MAG: MFS transporter [Caldilineaceae bacterium]